METDTTHWKQGDIHRTFFRQYRVDRASQIPSVSSVAFERCQKVPIPSWKRQWGRPTIGSAVLILPPAAVPMIILERRYFRSRQLTVCRSQPPTDLPSFKPPPVSRSRFDSLDVELDTFCEDALSGKR